MLLTASSGENLCLTTSAARSETYPSEVGVVGEWTGKQGNKQTDDMMDDSSSSMGATASGRGGSLFGGLEVLLEGETGKSKGEKNTRLESEGGFCIKLWACKLGGGEKEMDFHEDDEGNKPPSLDPLGNTTKKEVNWNASLAQEHKSVTPLASNSVP
ncbi:hypothetical protein ACA910_020600 [Epithemia clementina (nom. ined.)]